MDCKTMREQLIEGSLSGELRDTPAREHVDTCSACGKEWQAMQATLRLLDAWQAPEPSPFFDTRMTARLAAEKQQPQGWLARLRESLHVQWQPLVGAALAVTLGAGALIYQATAHRSVTS